MFVTTISSNNKKELNKISNYFPQEIKVFKKLFPVFPMEEVEITTNN